MLVALEAGCLPEAIPGLLFAQYMLNLGLLKSFSWAEHELMVVFHHKKAPPSGGAIGAACLWFSRDL
jgi:hypothetical protein